MPLHQDSFALAPVTPKLRVETLLAPHGMNKGVRVTNELMVTPQSEYEVPPPLRLMEIEVPQIKFVNALTPYLSDAAGYIPQVSETPETDAKFCTAPMTGEAAEQSTVTAPKVPLLETDAYPKRAVFPLAIAP